MRRIGMHALAIALVASAIPASSAGVNFYSIEREIALGKQLSAELERQAKFVDDPLLTEYVNRLAQNIARHADVPFSVTVRVIDSPDVNALTLPAGHIYVTRAMLRLTESEAELAFVLAHEIGHTAARHATREASRRTLWKLGSIPLSVFGGWTGAAIRQGAGTASQAGYMKGARDFESQADIFGLEAMIGTGYDPAAAIEMFERIASQEHVRSGRVDRLFHDHPLTAARIDGIEKHLRERGAPRLEYILTTSEYESMRLRVPANESAPAVKKP